MRYPLGDSYYPSDMVSRLIQSRKLKGNQQRGNPQFLTVRARVHRGRINGVDLRPEAFGRCVTVPKSMLGVSLSATRPPTAFLEVVSNEQSNGSNKIVKADLQTLLGNGDKFYLLEQANAVNMTTDRIKSAVRAGAVPSVLTRFGMALAEAESLSELSEQFFKSLPGVYEVGILASTMLTLLPESRCKVGIEGRSDPLDNFLVFDIHEIGYYLIKLLINDQPKTRRNQK